MKPFQPFDAIDDSQLGFSPLPYVEKGYMVMSDSPAFVTRRRHKGVIVSLLMLLVSLLLFTMDAFLGEAFIEASSEYAIGFFVLDGLCFIGSIVALVVALTCQNTRDQKSHFQLKSSKLKVIDGKLIEKESFTVLGVVAVVVEILSFIPSVFSVFMRIFALSTVSGFNPAFLGFGIAFAVAYVCLYGLLPVRIFYPMEYRYWTYTLNGESITYDRFRRSWEKGWPF